MLLYLIRHGQSVRNVLADGPHDCALTQVGERQAELTGAWLAGRGIQTLYCSPAIRTIQTAVAIGRALNLKPKVWDLLIEVGYLFEEPGLTGRELKENYPDVEIDGEFPADTGWAAHITQESWDELYARACLLKEEIIKRHPMGSPPAAFVTHAHVIRFLIGAFLEFGNPEHWKALFLQNNCGVTCVELRPDRCAIHFVNSHAHLGDLVTR